MVELQHLVQSVAVIDLPEYRKLSLRGTERGNNQKATIRITVA